MRPKEASRVAGNCILHLRHIARPCAKQKRRERFWTASAGPVGIAYREVGYKVGYTIKPKRCIKSARLLFKKKGPSERMGLFFG